MPKAKQPSKPSPELRVELVDVNSILPDPANVRLHPARNLEAVQASLAKFGQQKPIVVDEGGVVVAGNLTLQAAQALGWQQIAVVRTKLKGAEAVAFAIADNRCVELGTWDEDALAKALSALRDDPSIDEMVTGFDADEIDEVLGGDGAEPETASDQTEELLESFLVLVECDSEETQQALFQRLEAEGLTCRLLTR